MLGKYLGELQGKLTTQSVVESISDIPKLEVTVLREGNIDGIDVIDIGTFIVTSNPDGSSHA